MVLNGGIDDVGDGLGGKRWSAAGIDVTLPLDVHHRGKNLIESVLNRELDTIRAGLDDGIMEEREVSTSSVDVATEISGAVRDFGDQRFDEIGGDRVLDHREEVVAVGVNVSVDTVQLFGFGSYSGVKSGGDGGRDVIDGGLEGCVVGEQLGDAVLKTVDGEVMAFEARLDRATESALLFKLGFQLQHVRGRETIEVCHLKGLQALFNGEGRTGGKGDLRRSTWCGPGWGGRKWLKHRADVGDPLGGFQAVLRVGRFARWGELGRGRGRRWFSH